MNDLKAPFGAFLFLVSISALACPDMIGSYLCESASNHPVEINIRNFEYESRHPSFLLTIHDTSFLLITDNEWHLSRFEHEDGEVTVDRSKSYCEGNKLINNAELLIDDRLQAQAQMVLTLQADKLTVESSGKEGEVEFKNFLNCQRSY